METVTKVIKVSEQTNLRQSERSFGQVKNFRTQCQGDIKISGPNGKAT